MNCAKRIMTDFFFPSFLMLRVFVFIFKNALKSTWGISSCCPAAPFQQTCRMKASLLHPPGILSIALQKINPTNPANPNILKKLSTLEWMKWASVEEDNHVITQGGRWFALGHCCAIVPWLVPRALTNFSHVWGCFVPATAGVHRCCCEPYPDFHRMLAAAVAVWSLSLISWPRGHHPSACPPAHSRHPGLPQWTQDYNIAAPCSSDVLCPSLHCHYSQVHPVTMITTVWIYRDCNNASFKGCVSSVMYSGCFVARRDNWTLAAVLGMPCGFRHRISQLSYVWL